MGWIYTRATAVAAIAGLAFFCMSAPGCTNDYGPPIKSACPPGQTCEVRLTLLHSADIHSRLFAYDQVITQVDANLGLGPLDANAHIGGVTRLAYVINRERARSDRVLHLDSGDMFEGAPIFNFYNGEPEARYSSMIGVDAMVIGNHEFDHGINNLVTQYQTWTSFPILAANYDFESSTVPGYSALATIAQPFTVFNVEGLKVAVIGMGNLSSLGSLFSQPNSFGITPLNTREVAQFYVDLLRPYVDVVVMLSHLGLESDEDMVQNTTGIDIVLGGHNHIVINPPQQLQDCTADETQPGFIWEVDPNLQVSENGPPPDDATHPDPVNHPYMFHRPCKPRNVLIMHSGAFSKYLGRIDLTLSNTPSEASPTGNTADYDPNNGFEIVSSEYTPFPITDDLPEDPVIVDMLQPYQRVLDQVADLDILVGFSPGGAKRIASNGGDSPLGNLIATAMWLRLGVQTDFALTNSTGIRTDLNPGPITIEEMYNIFPFDNTISTMQLSGLEVQEMFDFVARRSASRGCASQAQIAGARVQLNCAGCSRVQANTPCQTDADCPSQVSGACQNNICQEESCAEQVYIGHEADPSDPSGQTYLACTKDSDCPENLLGQCDLGPPGYAGPGLCLSSVLGAAGSAQNGLTNLYSFATSNYLAAGGSGFVVLEHNTTQFNTLIEQRDSLVDYLRNGKPCGWINPTPTPFCTQGTPGSSGSTAGCPPTLVNAFGVPSIPYSKIPGTSATFGLNADGNQPCAQDSDCSSDNSIVCACPSHSTQNGTGATLTCTTSGQCDIVEGECVRADCRDQVAEFHAQRCETSPTASQCYTDLNACSLGGEECKFLACVDASLGNFADNRVDMLGK